MSEFNEKINPNEPNTLDELISDMQANSNRYDFSDEYMLENGHELGYMGEFMYGVSMTPTAWALPYLYELQKLKKEMNNEQ